MKNISLRKMNEEEFRLYFKNKIERYSDVLSENVHEEGEIPSSKARKQLNNLLPEGRKTPNHYLFNIYKDEQTIGFVWIKVEVEKKSAFLYEIFILEEYRAKGFGTAVINIIEDWLKEKEINYFKLHVFGNNTGAYKLYERLGFGIAGINMLKSIY
ncbi:GNAT family N-acetyltransferase [Neobacillus notoginsengisoli]|uniref:GNAT family N-acetyltransferase n=2 Tax=Neobacillus notoginsengisoli TaxID=1578198 RepID=A0A417YZM1_9BACI|nr:GNAT family N-acetyltransferase [Neobacillus notoginsengisoli]